MKLICVFISKKRHVTRNMHSFESQL
jgi:hypothetical protein